MGANIISKFDTMLAYYSFTGNADDTSGNGHNGTATNCTLTTDKNGHSNSAYSFNGTTGSGASRILVGTNAALQPTKFTVAVWVKTGSSIVTNKCIVSYGPANWNYGPAWEIDAGDSPNTGNWWFALWPGTFNRVKYGSTPLINTWYHLCGTYDGTYMRFYVNGTEQTAGGSPLASSLSYSNQNTGLTIGYNTQSGDGSPTATWNGVIDEVRYYGFVLSQAEVTALYNRVVY
jgi:trimeric autotransporter adhesin